MKSWSLGRNFVWSSRVRWKSERSSEVLSEPTEKSRSLPKKLIGTCQEDCRKVQELTGSPPEHCREIVRSSPEDRQKLAGRIDLRTCLAQIMSQISQLARNWVWIWANPIRGRLGPCEDCVGPNERPKQCPKKSHPHGIVFETMSDGGTASLGGCTTPSRVPSSGIASLGGGTTQQ